jgi:hypothetical protein
LINNSVNKMLIKRKYRQMESETNFHDVETKKVVSILSFRDCVGENPRRKHHFFLFLSSHFQIVAIPVFTKNIK